MTLTELIIAIMSFAIAGILILLSIRSFLERGSLLNNAYIYATEKERKTMDKKPYYRQSAIVFSLLGAVFIVIGVSVILQNYMIELLEIPLILCIIIYAVISSVKIRKRTKK